MRVWFCTLWVSRHVVRYLAGIFTDNPGKSLVLLVVYSAFRNAMVLLPARVVSLGLNAAFPMSYALLALGAGVLLIWLVNLLFAFHAFFVFLLGAISSRNARAPSWGWMQFREFTRRNEEKLAG